MQETGLLLRSESASFDAVVIASSLGGPATLRQILSEVPADFPVPILIVQHLYAHFSGRAEAFLAGSRLPVQWARHGERLRAGHVYLAPPDRHLRVTRWRTLRLSDEARVCYSRPAADVLFTSAAASFGARTLGLVLGGRLYDGTAGAAEIHQAGGVVIVQEPRTCRAPSMPQSALRRGVVDFVLPPERIPAALVSLVTVPGARALFGVERRSA